MKEKAALAKQETLICINLNYIRNFFFFLNYSKFFFNNNAQMLNFIKSNNIAISVISNLNKNLHYFYFYLFLTNIVLIKNLYSLNSLFILKNVVSIINKKNNIFLRIFKPYNNSMRFKKLVNKFYYFSNWRSLFYLRLKNLSGRSKNGKKIVRTKSKNRNNIYIIHFNNINTKLGLILNLCYSNYLKTFLFFVKNSNNQFYYIKGINGLFVSDFIKSISINPRYLTNFFLGFNILLRFCKKGFILSNISINQKNIYIKSPGTYGQVVDIIFELDLVIIKLPSLKKKFFNFNNYSVIGRNIFIDKKYQFYSKAGINRNDGFSSKVRGVAMNPVDHPHGGRTKTNSPEVSIWGWVAKRSH